MTAVLEGVRILPVWTVEKWDMPHGAELMAADDRAVILPSGKLDLSPAYRHLIGEPPDHRDVIPGNLATNAGLGAMLDLFAGIAGPSAFNNANTRMYVGDGTTAAAATQTDLQGSNKQEKAVDVGYPARSGTTMTWKGTYGSTDANFAWEEGGIKNGAGTPNGTSIILFNRKVQTLGTKASGAVWTLTLEISLV